MYIQSTLYCVQCTLYSVHCTYSREVSVVTFKSGCI